MPNIFFFFKFTVFIFLFHRCFPYRMKQSNTDRPDLQAHPYQGIACPPCPGHTRFHYPLLITPLSSKMDPMVTQSSDSSFWEDYYDRSDMQTPVDLMNSSGGPIVPSSFYPTVPAPECGAMNYRYNVPTAVVCGISFIFGIIFNFFGKDRLLALIFRRWLLRPT